MSVGGGKGEVIADKIRSLDHPFLQNSEGFFILFFEVISHSQVQPPRPNSPRPTPALVNSLVVVLWQVAQPVVALAASLVPDSRTLVLQKLKHPLPKPIKRSLTT